MTNQREAFEKWHLDTFKALASSFRFDVTQEYFQDPIWMAWQASQAHQADEIKELQSQVETLQIISDNYTKARFSNKQLQLDNKEMSERLVQCEKLAQSVMLDIGERNEQ